MSSGALIGIGVVIVIIAFFLLKGFDKVAGRGPKQIKDGINQSTISKQKNDRIPCPHCAELILPTAKKCPFCKSDLN